MHPKHPPVVSPLPRSPSTPPLGRRWSPSGDDPFIRLAPSGRKRRPSGLYGEARAFLGLPSDGNVPSRVDHLLPDQPPAVADFLNHLRDLLLSHFEETDVLWFYRTHPELIDIIHVVEGWSEEGMMERRRLAADAIGLGYTFEPAFFGCRLIGLRNAGGASVMWVRFLAAVERVFFEPSDRELSPEMAVHSIPGGVLPGGIRPDPTHYFDRPYWDTLITMFAENRMDEESDTDPRLLARRYLGICDDVDARPQYNKIREVFEHSPHTEEERLVLLSLFRLLAEYVEFSD